MKIELSNVSKKYGRLWIFKGINSSFESNSIYGLIGFNGSGKSTLLQIISGYITPNKGEISFFDRTNQELKIEDWYKSIAIAAPYLDLLEEFTVIESIELHTKFKELKPDVSTKTLLQEIDLEKHKNKLLSQLSSGMKQRLKLALAIYSNTPVLLVDEPCANLDKRWSDWFNTALSANAHDRIVIICTNSQENEMRCINNHILNVSDFQA